MFPSKQNPGPLPLPPYVRVRALLPLMLRTGFDSFAVTNPVAQRRLAENCLTGVAQRYQPTARNSEAVGGFSWRRLGSTGA